MNKDYYNSVSDYKLQTGYNQEKINFFKNQLGRLRKKLGRDLRILDAACNEGSLSQIYSEYGKVYGIELNEKAVEEAKKKNIEAISGDVFQMDIIFQDKKFDVVIAGDIIEHVFDTDLLLDKIHTVLDNEGLLLLSTPNLASLGRRCMLLAGKNPFCEYSTENDGINVGHIRYYTYDNLSTQLEKRGFQSVLIKSDTLNLPKLDRVNKFLAKNFPKWGKNLLAVCEKKMVY